MSNLPNYDELVAVRLELARTKDQRDALAHALKTDILKIAKVAIRQAAIDVDNQAADTIGCMGVELDDIKAENASLRAELERVTGGQVQEGFSYRSYVLLKADLADLKRQLGALKTTLSLVERENNELKSRTQHLPEFENAEIERLKKQVASLTKQKKFLLEKIEGGEGGQL